jgi:hypothetical protein
MTRSRILNETQAMMSGRGELLHNPAFGRASEAMQFDRQWARDLTRMVIRWLRVFAYGRRLGHFRISNAESEALT